VCLIAQGLISEYADGDGSYLRLGPPPTLFSIPINLNFGKNSIFTSGGSIQAFKRPTLQLNPINGSVTIGNTESDNAALTIKSFSEANNTLDLRLEGDGRMGIQRSMYIDLDDDNNEDSYFLIRDSEKANLFYVGETGDSYLKGDITITGDINLNGSIKGVEEMEIISGAAFDPQGSSKDVTKINTIVYLDEDTGALEANISLPHNAVVTKVQLIYLDNSENDIVVEFSSLLNLSHDYPTNHIKWDSSDESPDWRIVTIDNLNIVIDNVNRVYRAKLFSYDWGFETIEFRALKIYYTR